MASATSAPRKPSAPCAFSQPAIERRPVLYTAVVGTAGAAAALMQTHARTAASLPRMVPPFLAAYFTGFGVYSSAILSSKKLVGFGAAMKRR